MHLKRQTDLGMNKTTSPGKSSEEENHQIEATLTEKQQEPREEEAERRGEEGRGDSERRVEAEVLSGGLRMC